MLFIVYKTTNLLNNRYYIGMHRTENIDDGYLGSGKILKRAIKKYGKENFKREVLFIFDNENDMILKEAELVNEEFCKSDDNYNVATGGSGGDTLTFHPDIIEIKKKMSDKNIGRIPWNKGIPRTEEVKKTISEKNKGKISWNKGTQNDKSRWINNGKINKRVKNDELSYHKEDGFVIGRIASEKLKQHLKIQNDKRIGKVGITKGYPAWNKGMSKEQMMLYREGKNGV